ncbi:hypothetical protein NEFER03_1638 [Nematocida sp. LUAm3]|nr:hypothetical protein NEFER03_1638 [Nematocida sp. LUAm3]KAI5174662.1 hypothetical protein NEFER02_0772 [Nematocida sp. LUAm2]KAI5177928.1 hypothetical protein NEFER01_1130 [Nematocida sp. LUAm1]
MHVKFTSTGISAREKELVRRIFAETSYELEETLSAGTSYLLCSSNGFTGKRVLADRWGIPIISIEWVYKSLSTQCIMNYALRKYEGILFSATGISNPVYINYYLLLGGRYTGALSKECDFLLSACSLQESQKTEYANCHGIPVVYIDEVFLDRITKEEREVKYTVININKVQKEEIFNGILFFFLGESSIHREVHCAVVEHGGNRVQEIGADVQYSLYFGEKVKIPQKEGRPHLVMYQWVLDCVEVGALLSHEKYLVKEPEELPLLHYVFFLLVGKDEGIKCKNKIEALGGEVLGRMNSRVTHCIVEDISTLPASKRSSLLEVYRVKVCPIEWIDQCIYHMKSIKEPERPKSKRLITTEEVKEKRKILIRKEEYNLRGWIVQFTGVAEKEKEDALFVLTEYGAELIDSSSFSAECTHLIVGVLNVSLKFLSAIAAGCTLLDYEVIKDLRRGRYNPLKRYSLEERNISLETGRNEKIVKKVIENAPQWKERKERTGEKAFTHWKVLVQVTREREKFKELIQNGGGTIIHTLTHSNTHSITHSANNTPTANCITACTCVTACTCAVEQLGERVVEQLEERVGVRGGVYIFTDKKLKENTSMGAVEITLADIMKHLAGIRDK